MAKALSTLANDGKLVDPYIVSSIVYNGKEQKTGRSGLSQDKVFSDETTNAVTELLVNVFDNALLGGAVKKDLYSVASKTGTALLVNPSTKGYYEDKFFTFFLWIFSSI